MALVGAITTRTSAGGGRSDAPADVIGATLSRWLGLADVIVMAPLGALGAFFSGSTTVSNLIFGRTQLEAARALGLAPASVLALQTAAGSAGNMICLSNIIAGKSVCSCAVAEREFVRVNARACALHCLTLTLVASCMFLAGV